VVPGDRWELTADIANNGTFAATPVNLRLRVWDVLANEVSVEERAVGTPIPRIGPRRLFRRHHGLSGTYTWTIDLDPASLVAEGDEGNNSVSGSLTVGGSRNLVMLPEGRRYSPRTASWN